MSDSEQNSGPDISIMMENGSVAHAHGPQGGGANVIKDTTAASFMADVVEASQQVPVLVDFWAPWCGPCKQLTPILERAVQAANGAVRLVKINIDEEPEIAQQMRVQSVPTVFAFVDGRPVDGFAGAQPESKIKELINRLSGQDGPNPMDEMLDAADEAVETGNMEQATAIYSQVVQADRTNTRALCGLAKCIAAQGDTEQAQAILDMVPEDQKSSVEVQSAEAALNLAAKSAHAVVDMAAMEALRERLEADPKDFQAHYELALAQVAAGMKEEAVDSLMEIIQINKEWNDRAAHSQLLELFEAWGPKDEMTLYGRRRLSSVLFS